MTTKEKRDTSITGYFMAKVVLAILLIFIVWRFPSLTEKEWGIRITKGAFSFLIPGIIASIVRYIVISIYTTRHEGRKVRGNFVLGINRVTVVINVMLFIIAMMFVMGIHPIEFLTGMTIVAMAIAVTFRDYITNMLSGLFIMFSEQLSVGDFIEVDGNRGRITDITFSNIVLQNDDENIVTVPNNMVFTHPLVNLSAHRPQSFIINFELPFEMAANTEELELLLQNTLKYDLDIEPLEGEKLRVDKIGKDFIRYKIEIHSKTSNDRAHKRIENEILKKIVQFKAKFNAL